MNHRRPHQILPQSDPCASPAEIHLRYSHCLRNGKLRLVKVQWSKYKTWRFQVSCWKLSKVHRAVRAVHFCLLFLRHQGHEQLHLITAMPSHSHEPNDSHNLSFVHHETHVHPIHPLGFPINLFTCLLETTSFLTLLISTILDSPADTLGSRQTRSKQSGRDTALAPHWTDRMDWIRNNDPKLQIFQFQRLWTSISYISLYHTS